MGAHILCVPIEDPEAWPTLGPQVCEHIESNLVHGPGDIRGQRVSLDDDKRGLIYSMYEVFPRDPDHIAALMPVDKRTSLAELKQLAGRRRFKRAVLMLPKGWAKTEMASHIAECEVDPEGPVRCVGWDGHGNPIGGPVTDPYIPMVSYTEEMTEELAYGALLDILNNCARGRLFDLGLERIMRWGGGGKVEAVATSPNARDGARTTFQHFDETHRFVLPRLKRTHQTMQRNIPKRKAADAWGLETTTAYSPGEKSVAEGSHDYARAVALQKKPDSTLFFYYRAASDSHDLTTEAGQRKAAIEARGPHATKWSDIRAIVGEFKDPTAEFAYLCRTWFNLIVRDGGRAFAVEAWKKLARPKTVIANGSQVTLGFDGSRYEDSTALVAEDIITGHQWAVEVWEKPFGAEGEEWEVPEAEVDAAVEASFERWRVWRMYADPWGWRDELAKWAARWGSGKDGKIWAWPTNRWQAMAAAVKNYATAIQTGEITHDGDPIFAQHIGNACKRVLTLKDSDGKALWVLQKERPDSPMKMDVAMAGVLAHEARTDAIAAGVAKPAAPTLPIGDGEAVRERAPAFSGVRGKSF